MSNIADLFNKNISRWVAYATLNKTTNFYMPYLNQDGNESKNGVFKIIQGGIIPMYIVKDTSDISNPKMIGYNLLNALQQFEDISYDFTYDQINATTIDKIDALPNDYITLLTNELGNYFGYLVNSNVNPPDWSTDSVNGKPDPSDIFYLNVNNWIANYIQISQSDSKAEQLLYFTTYINMNSNNSTNGLLRLYSGDALIYYRKNPTDLSEVPSPSGFNLEEAVKNNLDWTSDNLPTKSTVNQMSSEYVGYYNKAFSDKKVDSTLLITEYGDGMMDPLSTTTSDYTVQSTIQDTKLKYGDIIVNQTNQTQQLESDNMKTIINIGIASIGLLIVANIIMKK